MQLNAQRRIAASLLGCSIDRVRFDPKYLNDIKEAITKSDMRLLISDGYVKAMPVRGTSRVRANKIRRQKSKGLRRGPGSRKGSSTRNSKEHWVAKVRLQRQFLQELKRKNHITLATYQGLYRKSKGGFFRSRRHLKVYLDDQRLWRSKA